MSIRTAEEYELEIAELKARIALTIEGEPGEQRYYVHDNTRGYVGNCMVWWKHNDAGYVCDITEARKFTLAELHHLDADDLLAYPVGYINDRVRCHIDMQSVDFKAGLKMPLPKNETTVLPKVTQ